MDEVVLGQDAQRQFAGLVLVFERYGETFAGREAGVGVRIVVALRGHVDFIEVNRADFGDDGQRELQFRLRVRPQAAAVRLARGDSELEGIILHEPRQEQRGQRDQHKHDDDDGATALADGHGVEAPERLMGRLTILVAFSAPRSKRRWMRTGFFQVVPPVSFTGSSSTFHSLSSAS